MRLLNLFKRKKVKLPDDAWEMHLCYLGDEGYQAQGTKVFKQLTKDPEYVCTHCHKTAHSPSNLCVPNKL